MTSILTVVPEENYLPSFDCDLVLKAVENAATGIVNLRNSSTEHWMYFSIRNGESCDPGYPRDWYYVTCRGSRGDAAHYSCGWQPRHRNVVGGEETSMQVMLVLMLVLAGCELLCVGKACWSFLRKLSLRTGPGCKSLVVEPRVQLLMQERRIHRARSLTSYSGIGSIVILASYAYSAYYDLTLHEPCSPYLGQVNGHLGEGSQFCSSLYKQITMQDKLYNSPIVPLVVFCIANISFRCFARLQTTQFLDLVNIVLYTIWIAKFWMLSGNNYTIYAWWSVLFAFAQSIFFGNAWLSGVLQLLLTAANIYNLKVWIDHPELQLKFDTSFDVYVNTQALFLGIFLLVMFSLEHAALSDVQAQVQAKISQTSTNLVSRLLKNTCDAVLEIDPEFRVTKSSEQAYILFCLSGQVVDKSLFGRTLLEFMSSEDSQRLQEHVRREIVSSSDEVPPYPIHLDLVNEGRVQRIQLHCSCVKDGGKEHILLGLVAVSENYTSETCLRMPPHGHEIERRLSADGQYHEGMPLSGQEGGRTPSESEASLDSVDEDVDDSNDFCFEYDFCLNVNSASESFRKFAGKNMDMKSLEKLFVSDEECAAFVHTHLRISLSQRKCKLPTEPWIWGPSLLQLPGRVSLAKPRYYLVYWQIYVQESTCWAYLRRVQFCKLRKGSRKIRQQDLTKILTPNAWQIKGCPSPILQSPSEGSAADRQVQGELGNRKHVRTLTSTRTML